jgi:hypothetical protein
MLSASNLINGRCLGYSVHFFMQYLGDIQVILVLYPDDTVLGILCNGHDCHVVNLSKLSL